jgi:5,8-dihydroxy-2-naphthoate synthase
LVDLGEWWEETTGLPLPLGGIAVSRKLVRSVQKAVEEAVRASVEYARTHPEAALTYIRAHAQEMDPAVCRAHIDLYVNEFTSDYGREGERAIRALLETAADSDVAPGSAKTLFWDE